MHSWQSLRRSRDDRNGKWRLNSATPIGFARRSTSYWTGAEPRCAWQTWNDVRLLNRMISPSSTCAATAPGAATAAVTPMVGASGAIMGLAGMYFVLFPVHKVHMAAWARWGLAFGFRLSLKMWAVRGFWVVLFYIAFDVVATAVGTESSTAHWAHLGGFIVGAVIALILLLARLLNARGGDIMSVILGRYAWALIGRPNRDLGFLQRLP